MPAIVPNRYPLDYSGNSAENFIENEAVTLTPGAFRAFSPLYSPFFKKNIHIVDSITGVPLQPTQYECHSLVASATAIAGAGNELYAVVVIKDEAISNSLTVDYQTVGGHYTTNYEALLVLISNLLGSNQIGNSDPVAWNTLSHLPDGFPENLHLHSLGATVGWEYLANALEKLKASILLGDQISKSFVLSYIDQAIAESAAMRATFTAPGTAFGDHVNGEANPHNVTKAQLELDFVENYPVATLAEAYAGEATNRYVTADQVLAVVRDAINLGMDSHIADRTNVHLVNKAQVGLALVQNYPVAEASELDTPVSGTPSYVTTHVAAAWLQAFFATLNSGNESAITALDTNSLSALVAAQAAQSEATAAHDAVTQAQTTIASAITTAGQALTVANQNVVDAQNAESAAMQLIQVYLSPALVATETAAYSRGFTDGVASMQ